MNLGRGDKVRISSDYYQESLQGRVAIVKRTYSTLVAVTTIDKTESFTIARALVEPVDNTGPVTLSYTLSAA